VPPWIRIASLALVAGLALLFFRTDRTARAPSATRGLSLVRNFNDSLPRNAGNALRCTSCHLDDGLRVSALPWAGVTGRYPKHRLRSGTIETIEHRVNDCITRSLAGQALPKDHLAMRDIVAYLESLRETPPPKPRDLVRLTGDTIRGGPLYQTQCARCHAADGGGSLAPAVYGARSYSIGAGMARQYTLATFLRWNMPYDMAGTLPAQDAADIAAWLLRRPRPDHPGKERDWPNGDPPPDVAYATDGVRRRGGVLPPPRPILPRTVLPNPPGQ